MNFHFIHLRQNSDCRGGGMDPSLCLSFRNTLDTMHAAFIFQTGIGSVTRDGERDLLISSQLCFIHIQKLCGPSFLLGVHGVHPKENGGKKGCLFPTCAAAYLHNHIFGIVWILGQKQNFQFLRKPICCFSCLFIFLCRQFTQLSFHTGSIHQFLGFLTLLNRFAVLRIRFDNRRNFPELLHQRGVLRGVGGNGGIRQLLC